MEWLISLGIGVLITIVCILFCKLLYIILRFIVNHEKIVDYLLIVVIISFFTIVAKIVRNDVKVNVNDDTTTTTTTTTTGMWQDTNLNK